MIFLYITENFLVSKGKRFSVKKLEVITCIISTIFVFTCSNFFMNSFVYQKFELYNVNSANYNEYAYLSHGDNRNNYLTIKPNDYDFITAHLDDVTIIQDLGQGASPIAETAPAQYYKIFGVTVYATLGNSVVLHVSDESQISKTPFDDWVNIDTTKEISVDIKKRSGTNK